MTHLKVPRVERLDGARLKIYDNGGTSRKNGSYDRFTAVYLDCPERERGMYEAFAMSEHPFHPQGFGQHTASCCHRRIGRRIPFSTLPVDCQKAVRQDTRNIGKSLQKKKAA